MSTLVTNHSSYPRVGERPEEQKLRRTLDRFDRKEITDQELEEVTCEVIREVIVAQERLKVDLVTDGQVRWPDPVSHWMRGLKGVKVGGLLRFFDTNCYFRVPRVDGPLERRETFLRRDLALSIKTSKNPVKAVLTGPVTLAVLSEKGAGFTTDESLIENLTSLMKDAIGDLVSEGVHSIQIDEPIVLKRPELLPVLSRVLKVFEKGKGGAKIFLATYFGDASSFYSRLQDLPADGLVLDCSYGPGLLEKIAVEGSDRLLALGVVDGRSTRLEAPEKLAMPLRRIRLAMGERELYLTSSCGLEYLPRARAVEKLTLLVKLKEMMT